MRTERGKFEHAGHLLVRRSWLPEAPVRGVVVLVHGVAEHSGRYDHVGRTLAAAGYAVHALDHVGHGESARIGAPANLGSIEDAADKVAALLALVRDEHPGVPAFVIGHSMGALITLHLATREPLDVAGVVVSAPPLIIDAGNPVQRLLAPVLTRLTPNLGVLALDSSQISRDPDVVTAYDNDPLVFRGRLPARTATEILTAAGQVLDRLPQLRVPTLAMHGTADAIAAPASTDRIEQHAGTTDLTVRRYDGLYHEIFNEPERDQVLADVVTWLTDRLPEPGQPDDGGV
ncbi:alpha/beta hydrolase [Nocardia flavorosea]|uniref:Monoacylglycerol lipase n=1 Tax=Nocardia flavorosea TaxID=53429 RepID=A0A846YIG8_9NOCA|nr:alpha/beta hydrolase [Nocardia flavorosea]